MPHLLRGARRRQRWCRRRRTEGYGLGLCRCRRRTRTARRPRRRRWGAEVSRGPAYNFPIWMLIFRIRAHATRRRPARYR